MHRFDAVGIPRIFDAVSGKICRKTGVERLCRQVLNKIEAKLRFVRFRTGHFTASHFWLATVQEVLHADWQEDWHLPQPPFSAEALRLALLIVLICFKGNTSFFMYCV